MTRTHLAAEKRSCQQALAELPVVEAHLAKILNRLRPITGVSLAHARLQALGAAGGLVLIAAGRLGLRAVGIEPYAPACKVAQDLARDLGVRIDIRPGAAEATGLAEESFDIVHASSVLEHVRDPQQVLRQAYHVLRPGGVLWFCTTNSLCPRQQEIAVFPCFSWYPNRLKRTIMHWAVRRRPKWVGGTQTPAIHWFTPAKAHRMLRRAGFRVIYDRWDLRRPEEGERVHRLVLRLIRGVGAVRLLAEICVQGGSYAAVK